MIKEIIQDKVVINTFRAEKGSLQWEYNVGFPISGFSVELGGILTDFLIDVLRFHSEGEKIILRYGGGENFKAMGRAYIKCQTEEGEKLICIYLKLI